MEFLWIYWILLGTSLIMLLLSCLWCNKTTESFEEKLPPSDPCSILVDALDDDKEKEDLGKGVKNVNVENGHFIQFMNEEKRFEAGKSYCYIEDFHPVEPYKGLTCNKNTSIYQFPMIKSLELAKLKNPLNGEKDFFQACVMEIDPKHVNKSDVVYFKKLLDRYRSNYFSKDLAACNSRVDFEKSRYDYINSEFARASEDVKTCGENYSTCEKTKKELNVKMSLQMGELNAYKNIVTLLDIDSFTPILIYNNASENNKRDVELDKANITHIFLPPQTKLRLFQKNIFVMNYTREYMHYPRTTGIDMSQITYAQLV